MLPAPMHVVQTSAIGAGQRVLLFYDGFERKAWSWPAGQMCSRARGALRYCYRTIKRTQPHTGFFAAFLALCESLKRAGCEVRINDFAAARNDPHYPIGLAGYPSVLSATDALPNPRIFGPGDFGAPPTSVRLAKDDRFRILIQPSDWYADYFRPYCGAKLMVWFAGIDTNKWRLQSPTNKPVDFLIYDKIRWNREVMNQSLLARVVSALEGRQTSFLVLRYGHHHRDDFERALKRCKAMIFLCEHETQGLAYQEAMSCGVPVLAWDEGELVDPRERPLAPKNLNVSSVPYFDERCGRRFTIENFENELDLFQSALSDFRPRAYVEENLSLRRSAELYLSAYRSLVG